MGKGPVVEYAVLSGLSCPVQALREREIKTEKRGLIQEEQYNSRSNAFNAVEPGEFVIFKDLQHHENEERKPYKHVVVGIQLPVISAYG